MDISRLSLDIQLFVLVLMLRYKEAYAERKNIKAYLDFLILVLFYNGDIFGLSNA